MSPSPARGDARRRIAITVDGIMQGIAAPHAGRIPAEIAR